MRVTIRKAGVRTGREFRKVMEERIRLIFSGVEERVRHVLVHLSDSNGPRGGIDKRCVVQLRLQSGRTVQVHGVDISVVTALESTLRVALKSLRRLIERSREVNMRRMPLNFALAEGDGDDPYWQRRVR